MASAEKKYLESILKPMLKEYGFRKRGGTWWKQLEEFIQVVNIQGSQFSKRFYINLGVYIKALGKNEWPAEYDCHIRVRLSSIANHEVVDTLLNYENRLESIERIKIASLLQEVGINWLEKCSSFKGAKEEYTLPNRVMTEHQREVLDEYFA